MAAIPFDYILIIISWTLLFIAFFIKEDMATKYVFMMLGSMMLMVIGINIITTGLGETANFATQAFGFVHMFLASYVLIKSNFAMWGTK